MAAQQQDDDQELDNDEEEVETPDTGEDDADADDQDEDQDDSAEEEAEDEEDSDDDESDDSEEDDEETTEFNKRFSQIKGDTPEEYLANLEDAYSKSSTEGQRLNGELTKTQQQVDKIMALVAKDPELAKKIETVAGDDAEDVLVDPALAYARAEMQKQMKTDYEEFVAEHSELEDDPELQQEVANLLEQFGEVARKQGKILTMREGLEKAWAFLGKDRDDKDELRNKVKKTAAKPSTSSSKKPKAASKLTPEQLAIAKRFGLSEKEVLANYT
jgi:hypothetical protein